MAQGGMADKTVGALHGNVQDIHNRVIKAIQALNKYTHVRPVSVITDQIQIDTFATDTFNAFQELFYARKFCHSLIISAMHRRHSKALHSFVSRSLATHDEIKSRTDLETPDLEEFTHYQDEMPSGQTGSAKENQRRNRRGGIPRGRLLISGCGTAFPRSIKTSCGSTNGAYVNRRQLA